MDIVRNEPVVIHRTERTYTVVTHSGERVYSTGTLKILGDFVIIGRDVFHRPDRVE